MSHGATSSGVMSFPRFGLSANAADENKPSAQAAATAALCVDMLHLSLLGHAPGRDRIGVVDRPASTIGDHFLARWLDVAYVVGRAALQDSGAAVPAPRHAETRQRLRQHRLLQSCRRPTLAAVSRDFDLGDLAITRPGKACDLVDARLLHGESRRWTRNHRLAFL